MAKSCLTCGKRCYGAYCVQHKPRVPLKRSPIKKKAPTTRKPKTKKGTESRSELVKRLDSVFSQYIRLKDSVGGPASCVTCGGTKPWKEMQNGHFFTRGRQTTRWDEMNCHVQDYRCNVILSGNYINYTRFMIDRYGREAVDELEKKSLSGEKITTPELRERIEYYKNKVNELLKKEICQ